MDRNKIVLGMSGGVDSSGSAVKLLREDWEVIGVSLKMGSHFTEEMEADAKNVATQLGIQHHTVDVSENFNSHVMDYFRGQYKMGLTPNPCVVCNRMVKFQGLFDFANKIGVDYIATGHYAQLDGGVLRRATDKSKDQSYFLAMLKREWLSRIRFPLGHMLKSETRELLSSHSIKISEKKDSQDICFVPDRDYKKILGPSLQGFIRRLDGKIIGEHRGIVNYTIGQRKGLGIGGGEPLYVVGLDPETNTVFAGSESDACRDRLDISNVNLLADIDFGKKTRLDVRLRSSHAPQVAFVTIHENGEATVELEKPAFAITPGQLCAMYDRDILVGGGWIR